METETAVKDHKTLTDQIQLAAILTYAHKLVKFLLTEKKK